MMEGTFDELNMPHCRVCHADFVCMQDERKS